MRAEIVSPPPSTDIRDFFSVFSEIFLAIANVPLENSAFSKYPAGPFHKTVFDSSITFSILSIVFGPISKIISLELIESIFFVFPLPLKLVETLQSSGIKISQLFFWPQSIFFQLSFPSFFLSMTFLFLVHSK